MVILENMKYLMTNSKYAEQNTRKPSDTNPDIPTLQSAPVFVLCERCYWCATYLDTNRLLKEEGIDDNSKIYDNNKICPRCDSIDCLSSLPILSNESFTFNYTVIMQF